MKSNDTAGTVIQVWKLVFIKVAFVKSLGSLPLCAESFVKRNTTC